MTVVLGQNRMFRSGCCCDKGDNHLRAGFVLLGIIYSHRGMRRKRLSALVIGHPGAISPSVIRLALVYGKEYLTGVRGLRYCRVEHNITVLQEV